ncbi:MAG: KamA family radical SAM protein [archaeon]
MRPENSQAENACEISDEPPPNLYINSNNSVLILLPEWKKILKGSISSPKSISKKFRLQENKINEVCQKYPARINPYYLSLIKEIGDPIYKQCIPSELEISDSSGKEDPLHEDPENQLKQNVPTLVTHRYPDRVLFRISNQCAMYCRFCTRKRKVGDIQKNPKWSEILEGLNYIKNNEEIRDVLFSGGDPLMIPDKILEKIIGEVHTILKKRKFSIMRIGTRTPCTLPQRITPELCAMLKKYSPLYINTHFNHPSEITPESKKACEMLSDAGIPLGCQTVLLKGVNDDPEVIKELMQSLISIKVKPYYIYQADPVKGTNHFRTKVEKGLEIYKSLRGHTSGLCVPTYVIDAPGGGGKIPVLPEYLKEINSKKVVLENYEGKICEYEQIDE